MTKFFGTPKNFVISIVDCTLSCNLLNCMHNKNVFPLKDCIIFTAKQSTLQNFLHQFLEILGKETLEFGLNSIHQWGHHAPRLTILHSSRFQSVL